MKDPKDLLGRLGNRLFQMAYIYAQMRDGNIPDIYLQNENYFEKYTEEIKNWYGDNITKIDKVAIHVRRGDYVENNFYVDLLLTDYYEKAMDLFSDKNFLVFSDDIAYCKQQEIFKHCEFSEGYADFEDLNRMAGCKSIIMANSSFSWWAAYLSTGTVVTPRAWYADGITRTTCPAAWLRL